MKQKIHLPIKPKNVIFFNSRSFSRRNTSNKNKKLYIVFAIVFQPKQKTSKKKYCALCKQGFLMKRREQRVRSSVLPEHRGYFAARGTWSPCAHVHQSLAALLLLEFSCVFHDMLSRFGTILSFVLNDAAWTMEPANRLYGICNAALDARV